MKGFIRSIDFAAHGAKGSILTDEQIDEYSLAGRYGNKEQQRVLDDIRHRRLTRLDKRIKKGEFGVLAIQAVNQRRRRTVSGVGKPFRVKSTKGLSPLQIQALKNMGIDIDALKS